MRLLRQNVCPELLSDQFGSFATQYVHLLGLLSDLKSSSAFHRARYNSQFREWLSDMVQERRRNHDDPHPKTGLCNLHATFSDRQ